MIFDRTIRQDRTPDLTGQVFGRLTVISFAGYANQRAFWFCRCIEGTVEAYQASRLTTGNIQSCGCLSRECLAQGNPTHGHSHTPEYRIWAKMLERCHNKNCKSYARYGGRGIFVCDAWRNSFENFLADLGKRPTSKHSIERVDNDQGYSPENTIWATQYEQSRNTRRNRMLTYNGETLVLEDWAKKTGISRGTINTRLELGWPLELALTVLPSSSNRRKNLR